MATVKGWAIRASATTAIAYVLDLKHDLEKTTGGYLTHSSDPRSGPPEFASETWKRWREDRISQTGQDPKIQAYHFIQSFEPGTVVPEQVFDISKQWADEITQGKYPYVLAVHTDKKHLHAHIVVHPFEKGTGKMWDIFWRNDLGKFRAVSDRICKENGLTVIQPKSKARTYNEWLEDAGDGQQTRIRKLIDYVAPRVTTYEQFKEVFARMNIRIEDGTLPAEANEHLSAFSFTANRVLFGPEKVFGCYSIRMPRTQNYIQIPKECIRWIYHDQVAAITLPIEQEFQTLRFEKDGSIVKGTVGIKEIQEHFQENNYQKRTRQGLRMKLPYGRRFLKTQYIRSDVIGGECSLENVKKRIEENQETDPEMLDFLQTDDLEKIENGRKAIYKNADVKFAKWHRDPWQDRDWYLSYIRDRAETSWQMIEWERAMRKEMKSRPGLMESKEKLQKEIKTVSDLIEQLEKKVAKMEVDLIEHTEGTEPEFVERYIKENLDPLIQTRNHLIQEMGYINKSLMDLDRFEKYEKRKAERKEVVR